MTRHEKNTFIRFTFIYMLISFLLFLVLGFYYYFDQKRLIEDRLAVEMSTYAGAYRQSGSKSLPKGFNATLENKNKYPYPAFLHNDDTYINTSCAGSLYPEDIIVVESKPEIIKQRLEQLKEKFYIFMIVSFIVNLFISLFLSWLSLRPIRLANQQFRQFVDDVIHDLNAPVSALSINMESMLNSYNDDRLLRMGRSIDSIKNLYLNLEVLLKERYEAVVEPMNISEICNKVVAQLEVIYPDVVFDVNVPSIYVKMNAVTFERIIINLIENAAKYTQNNPLVSIGVDSQNRFYVKDNGPGIDKSVELFKRSKQGKKENTGYGLGLSIVSRLSDECQIDFETHSIKGEGTGFYFDISSHIVVNT